MLIDDTNDDNSLVKIRRMGLDGTAVSKKAFIKALKNDIAPEVGLLPPGVRWVSPSHKIWVFERAPETITIEHAAAFLDEVDDDTERRTYDLRMPWLAYVVDLDQTYYPESIFVYALNGPIRDRRDFIGVLPLSNFSTAGKLCQPHRGQVNEQPKSIGEGLMLAYRMVWSSGFNMDLDANFHWCLGLKKPLSLFSGRQTYHPRDITRAWERLTDAQVEAINDWPAPRHFDRYMLTEAPGLVQQEGADIEMRARDGYVYGYTIQQVANEAVSLDQQRRGNWDAASIEMTFQSAVSASGLYV